MIKLKSAAALVKPSGFWVIGAAILLPVILRVEVPLRPCLGEAT